MGINDAFKLSDKLSEDIRLFLKSLSTIKKYYVSLGIAQSRSDMVAIFIEDLDVLIEEGSFFACVCGFKLHVKKEILTKISGKEICGKAHSIDVKNFSDNEGVILDISENIVEKDILSTVLECEPDPDWKPRGDRP
ncbi:MAG: hypothetical protein ACLFU4_01100 [Opitutales bacterium]